MIRRATTSGATTSEATNAAARKASRRATQRAGALSVLLAASLALLPSTAAHADGIRAQQWALDAMHTQQAWRTTKGQGITVAVLDTGVDDQHPDLVGNVLTGKDMVGFGAQRGDRAWARHGTAMAGIITGHGHGVGNGDGVLGIAPEAKILPVRVILEDGDSARTRARNTRGNALAEGIRWATDQGADVINLSLGDDSKSAHPEPAEDAAVQYALKKGAVVVASAGNGGEKGDHISYPAAYPGVIAATAVDQNGTRASFSTRRWYATVSAPASTSSSPTRTTSTTRAGAPAPPPRSSPARSRSSRRPTRACPRRRSRSSWRTPPATPPAAAATTPAASASSTPRRPSRPQAASSRTARTRRRTARSTSVRAPTPPRTTTSRLAGWARRRAARAWSCWPRR